MKKQHYSVLSTWGRNTTSIVSCARLGLIVAQNFTYSEVSNQWEGEAVAGKG